MTTRPTLIPYSDWVATPNGSRIKATLVCSSTSSSSGVGAASDLKGLAPPPLLRASALVEPLVPAKEFVPDDEVVYEMKRPLPLGPWNGLCDPAKGPSLRQYGSKKGDSGGGMSLPPMFNSTVIIKHKFFFRANAALTAVSCGLGGFLGAMGGICTAANSTVTPWTSSCRIRSIRAWPPQVAGSDNVFVDWVGEAGYVPDWSIDRCLPDGITSTGCLVFKPPPRSLAGYWFNAGTIALGTNLVTITAPAGAIFEVAMEGTLCNVSSCAGVSVAAGVLGTTYYLALDGPANNKIRPVGLLTTA